MRDMEIRFRSRPADRRHHARRLRGAHAPNLVPRPGGAQPFEAVGLAIYGAVVDGVNPTAALCSRAAMVRGASGVDSVRKRTTGEVE